MEIGPVFAKSPYVSFSICENDWECMESSGNQQISTYLQIELGQKLVCQLIQPFTILNDIRTAIQTPQQLDLQMAPYGACEVVQSKFEATQ